MEEEPVVIRKKKARRGKTSKGRKRAMRRAEEQDQGSQGAPGMPNTGQATNIGFAQYGTTIVNNFVNVFQNGIAPMAQSGWLAAAMAGQGFRQAHGCQDPGNSTDTIETVPETVLDSIAMTPVNVMMMILPVMLMLMIVMKLAQYWPGKLIAKWRKTVVALILLALFMLGSGKIPGETRRNVFCTEKDAFLIDVTINGKTFKAMLDTGPI